MTIADRITLIRVILAPFFFIIYLLPWFFPVLFPAPPVWTVPVLWFLFVFSEITDMLDGMIARIRNEVSDFGKLFDPFADTLTQITYFLCFVIDGIFSPLLFLLVLYREFGILFVRNLMLKRGVALGARISGKIKTVMYIIAGGLALLASSVIRLGFGGDLYRWLLLAAKGAFVLSVAISLLSFVDYLVLLMKTPKTNK